MTGYAVKPAACAHAGPDVGNHPADARSKIRGRRPDHQFDFAFRLRQRALGTRNRIGGTFDRRSGIKCDVGLGHPTCGPLFAYEASYEFEPQDEKTTQDDSETSSAGLRSGGCFSRRWMFWTDTRLSNPRRRQLMLTWQRRRSHRGDEDDYAVSLCADAVFPPA